MNFGAASFSDLHWLLDIIQSTDIGVLVLNRDLDIEVFNRFMQTHSGRSPDDVIGANVLDVFPELDDGWFTRRVKSVFELGIPVYTSWEQRAFVFHFPLHFPLHFDMDVMYQNTTFVPLRSVSDEVERVGIVVYDVTRVALNKAKLEDTQKQLLKLSRTDKLTALWNRGYWEERLGQEFKRARRTGEKMSLVMFDIDHFKNINDTYGHQCGDEAIRLVSRLLLDNSREIDICGRYGGEEFVIILPDTDAAGAVTFCERLRIALEQQQLTTPAGEVQFTVSLGAAELEPAVDTAEQWLKRSDQALYQSKQGGRNRTTVYGAPA